MRRGHFPDVMRLNPDQFGHPVSRPRLYIMMVSQSMMNQLGADEHKIVSWAREIMTKFVGHGTVPLDSFLLDEENPAILAMLEKAHRKSVVEPTDTDIGADGRKGKGASDWAPKHFKITSELGEPSEPHEGGLGGPQLLPT